MRRGHHFVPKFLFGKPIDSGSDLLYRLNAPHWMHRMVSTLPLRVAMGKPADWGLPLPDHKFLDEPPIPNSELIHAVGHGRVRVKPAIKAFHDKWVEFDDGSREAIDVIVFATGYRIHFPFLDASVVDGSLPPQLFLNAFHPHHDDLMFAGLFDASVKTWQLVERQAELMAEFIKARDRSASAVEWFRQLKSVPDRTLGNGAATSHRFLYREYFAYRRQLSRLLKRLRRS